MRLLMHMISLPRSLLDDHMLYKSCNLSAFIVKDSD